MAEPAAVTDEFWHKLAEQGWLGIVYPEEEGGSGLGLVDLVVLMEEMGRRSCRARSCRRYCSAARRSPRPARRRSAGEWLPQIAAGEAKAALAWTEPNLRWDAAGITLPAREAGGGFNLSGTKLFVGDAHLADILVIAARTRDGSTMEDGVSLFLVPKDTPGLTVSVLPTIDETRKLCEVGLDNVALPAAAPARRNSIGGWAPLSRVVDRATVALAPRCAAVHSRCST